MSFIDTFLCNVWLVLLLWWDVELRPWHWNETCLSNSISLSDWFLWIRWIHKAQKTFSEYILSTQCVTIQRVLLLLLLLWEWRRRWYNYQSSHKWSEEHTMKYVGYCRGFFYRLRIAINRHCTCHWKCLEVWVGYVTHKDLLVQSPTLKHTHHSDIHISNLSAPRSTWNENLYASLNINENTRQWPNLYLIESNKK